MYVMYVAPQPGRAELGFGHPAHGRLLSGTPLLCQPQRQFTQETQEAVSYNEKKAVFGVRCASS